MTLFTGAITFLVVLITAPQLHALNGNDFNPGYIIDDSVFFNSGGMDIPTIQAFLNSKVLVCDTYHASSNPSYQPPFTCLKDYRQDVQGKGAEPGLCNGISSGNKSSAEIIFEVSQSCGVSPKVLIVLLEKEQGLITDTWPWSIQYRSATGYGCPDTAPCDAEYYGFSNQLYNAARQFKKYARDESLFRYRPYRTNFIQYNPDSNCGGSDVVIQNKATSGLYNYTPYQPNAATKVAAPGQTVACGAYGNINFWRYFNNWFGPTNTEGFSLMTSYNDNGDPRQWVVYKGIKRYVPSAAILKAWKLDQVPLIQVTGLYLGAIPTTTQPLDRLMRPTGTLDVYFVDNGQCFRLSSLEAMAAWGLNPATIVDVSEDLGRLPTNQGDITYGVKTASSSATYLMDGGRLRQFQNPDVRDAFEGVGTLQTTISQDYFASLPQGESISTPRIADSSGTNYIVSNRTKYVLNNTTKDLFPWVATAVNVQTIQRMDTAELKPFIKSLSDPKVYVIDQQKKNHITDPAILNAWQPTGQSGVTTVSQGVTNLIPNGMQISDYFAMNNSTYYIVNKTKKQIPSQQVVAFTSTRSTYAASQTLMNLYGNNGGTTFFVRASGQTEVYLLTNSGVLRHITSPQKLNLWAGEQPVTELPSGVISKYYKGGSIGVYVSDGTGNYVMDGGQKAPVSEDVRANWGLTQPYVLNDGTLSLIPTSQPLSNTLQNSNQYFIISEGVGYGTVDKNIADLWLLTDAPVKNLNLLTEFLQPQQLTRFVKSKIANDTRLFAVDNGNLYHLSPEHSANLNTTGPYTYVDPEVISRQQIQPWTGILIKSKSGQYFVIDEGGKRTFGNSIVFDHWRRTVSLSSIPEVSDTFANLLRSKGPIDRAIKGSGIAIYSADSITKRWIRSPYSFNSLFSSYTPVSDSLIRVLPIGEDIP